MSLKKSVLLALLVVLFSVPALWYTVAIPYRLAETFFQQAPTYLETIINETYPNDLEVTITNGVVTLNRPTPYCLTLDKKTYKGVLFDPNFNPEMYKPEILSSYPLCTPIFVVGDTTILYPENNQLGYGVTNIAPSVNMNVDKEFIDATTKGMLPVLIQWGWMLYLFAPVILIPVVFLIVLICNVWYAFINKIIFSLMDNEEYAPFLKSYALSLRFLSIIIIVCATIWVYDFQNASRSTFSFPFLNTIIIAVLSVLWAKKHSRTLLSQMPPVEATPVESHVIPSPNTPESELSLSDSKPNTGYTFDPTVISTPTEKKENSS